MPKPQSASNKGVNSLIARYTSLVYGHEKKCHASHKDPRNMSGSQRTLLLFPH
jgi:hypothetical protein